MNLILNRDFINFDLTDSEVKQYRDWILSQDDIESIEVRILKKLLKMPKKS